MPRPPSSAEHKQRHEQPRSSRRSSDSTLIMCLEQARHSVPRRSRGGQSRAYLTRGCFATNAAPPFNKSRRSGGHHGGWLPPRTRSLRRPNDTCCRWQTRSNLVMLRCATSKRTGGDSRVDGPFYDALETRDPTEREAALMAALPQIVAAAQEHAPAYRDRFAAVRAADITDRRALADLPLTRKSDLIELQRQEPALWRVLRRAGRRSRADLRLARADLRAGGAAAGFLPHGARALCRRHPRRRSRCTTRSPII